MATDPRLQNFEMTGPAKDGYDVTPSDSTDLDPPARALWIGVEGNVRITTLGGTVLDFASVPAGVFEWGAVRVHDTGTTATGIKAVTE